MSEDWLYVGLAPSDVFQRLHDGLRKILETDDNFIEAYLEDALVRIQITPKNQGSELKISYNFTKYWIMLTLVTLSLIPIFLILDKVLFGRPDSTFITIPLVMLIGWYLMKDYDEKKKREKIRKRIMKILQPNSKRK